MIYFPRKRCLRSNVARSLKVQPLEPRTLLAADPVITEFQAQNTETVADEDGDFSDWIELYNPDAEPISLGGWYLTDEPTDLRKWQFPAETSLNAGQRMLVFASGKDRTDATSQLHTGFRLSVDGEFLGLVKPDGLSVAQSFDYPQQTADGSYGLGAGQVVTELVGSGSPVTAFVPSDDSLGTSWTELGFDDANWLSDTSGVGYESLQPAFSLRDDFDALDGAWTIDNPAGATVEVTGGALVLNPPDDLDTAADDRGAAPIVRRDIPAFPGSPDVTPATWEMVTHVTQQPDDRGTVGLMIYDGTTQTPRIKFQYASRSRFEFRADEDRKESDSESGEETYFLRLARDGLARTWTAYFKIEEADPWTLVGSIEDGVDDVPVVADPQPALFATTTTGTMHASFDFVEFDIPDERPTYGPRIGLDVQDQLEGQNGSLYMRLPFDVDGDPARFERLDMSLRFDDGYRAYLNGQVISERNAPLPPPPPAPNVLPWDAHAEGTHGSDGGPVPVVKVSLDDVRDLLRTGTNLLAVQGLNIEADDRDFFFEAELFGSQPSTGREQFFATPTPGEANSLPAPPAPVIIGQQGMFFGSTIVEIELAEPSPDLEIRYTLDGSEPTETSRLYDGPVVLTRTAMLQARALETSDDPSVEPGPVSAATFVAAGEELRTRTSDIPMIILDTLGDRIPASGSTNLTAVNVIAMDLSRNTGRSSWVGGNLDYLGRGGIRDRGSSTAGQGKPNLTFETWGASGTTDDDDENVGLLGFSAESDWVLHAPYNFDRAMIRNQLAYSLSNQAGQWAPGTRAVEVYLNRRDGIVTEADYMGVYVLTEKITQGPGRLDIAGIGREDNAEPEIGGGYIWKIDRTDPDAPTFSGGGINANWVEPKSPSSRTARDEQKATLDQQRWVIRHFGELGDALRAPDIHDPEGYSKYIDVRAWVDHHLLSVFQDDVDAFALSAYLHKDRDGKIAMGPLWDFDRSAESLDDRDDNPELWGGSGGSNFFSRGWYASVFRDPGFWQAYVDRWTELRRTVLSVENLDATIDRLAGEIEESQARNFQVSVNRGVRPRRASAFASGKLDGTWEGEVEHLRKWLHDRLAFIDSNFTGIPSLAMEGERLALVDPETNAPLKGVSVTAGQQIEILPPELLTFDDISFFSGQPGETTARYWVPSDNALGDDWTAVGFDDSAWPSGTLGIGFDTLNADTGEVTGDYADVISTLIPSPNEAQPGATTVMARVAFDADPAALSDDRQLVLRMKYDDGFVAYLNGTQIISHNLRDDQLAWDSRANTRRSSRDSEIADTPEDFDITEFSDLLQEGTNVLSVRAINSTAGSNDLLLFPELVSRRTFFGFSQTATVYYTTDGSDPRGPDGNPAPSAVLAELGDALTVNENTRVIARAFDDVAGRGSEARIVRTDWGAPFQYDFAVAASPLVISEINYHPAAANQAEFEAGYRADDFEFIELHNPDVVAASLVGVELTDGVAYDFLDSGIPAIEPGGYALVVSNADAFQLRYGAGLPVAGVFDGQLDNGGEDVDLLDAAGQVAFSVNYSDSDPWAIRADGAGATLELTDPAGTGQDRQSKWYSWQASSEFGGSPGRGGDGPVGVVINELIANPQANAAVQSDSVELLNVTGQAVDLSGWYLSDSADEPFKFEIPPGTVLAAGQYLVFDEGDFTFALSGPRGDSVWLVAGTVESGISTFGDDVHFDATMNGESLGRVPNGSGRLAPLQRPSFNAENSSPRVGPIVVSEIQYHPVVSAAALALDPLLNESDLEFIEIYNPTTRAVDLTGWRVRGGADFDFDDGTLIRSGESVVILNFNPERPENASRLAAFKTQYGVGDQVQLLGGYAGQLNNSDERVILRRPIVLPSDGVSRVQEDEVLYDDLQPWPGSADGTGFSLQRTEAGAFGNDGRSWTAGAATPGSLLSGLPADFDGSGTVDVVDIDLLFGQMRAANPDLRFDLTNDGLVDQSDRDQLIQGVVGTGYGDSNLDGLFNSTDLLSLVQNGHFEDGIPLNSGWSDGDWDGDGDFTTSDLVLAFSDGMYNTAATPRDRLAAIERLFDAG